MLQSVSVDRFPIITAYAAKVRQRSPKVSLIEQTIFIRVPDRDDDEMMVEIRFDLNRPCRLDCLTSHRVLKTVRDALHFVVRHEMDECLLVDGVRVFDQHASDGQEPHGNATKLGPGRHRPARFRLHGSQVGTG